MIETAAIVWAGVSTVLGIIAGLGWRLQANVSSRRLSEIHRLQQWCKTYELECKRATEALVAARDKLDAIYVQRHRIAKNARARQIEQQRIKREETTEKLKAGVGR